MITMKDLSEKYANKEELKEMTDKLGNMFQSLLNIEVTNNGSNIRYIEEPTEEQCLIAIEQDGNNIQYIKEPTIEMWNKAIEQDPHSIKYLDSDGWKDSRIYGIFRMAIDKDPFVIKYAVKHFYDRNLYLDLCEHAFDKNWGVFKYIDTPTLHFIYKIIKYEAKYVTYLNNTKWGASGLNSRYMYAIKINPESLSYINDQTYEMCLEAVKSFSMTLKYVKEEFCTEELCFAAVTKNCLAIEYVPRDEYRMSDRVCIKAIETRPINIRYVSGICSNNVYEYLIKNSSSEYWDDCKGYVKTNGSLKLKFLKLLKNIGFFKNKVSIECIE